MVKQKGKFIVFEGLDGSGQTTQAGLLRDYLERIGKKVLLTKEPTNDSEAGKAIQEILHDKKQVGAGELQELFAADRKAHLENVIIPSLRKGITVISDRYFFSSFAFGSLGCDLERLISINAGFLLPDATFVLTVKPETAVERISKRGEDTTFFEKLEKLRKVAENYKNLGSRFENLFFIDGERSIDEIHREIVSKISNTLK